MLKKRKNKLLILIIISILMFNFIGTNVVMAVSSNFYTDTGLTIASNTNNTNTTNSDFFNATTTKTPSKTEDPMKSIVESSTGLDQEMEAANKMSLSDNGLLVLDGIVGILTYFERFKVIIIGGVCQFLATVVGESAGSTEKMTVISPEDILFNKLAITDINFFNINTFGSNNTSLSGDNNPIKLLKQNVAKWYMTLRTVALIILLAVLIYIGIRMAMSSVASEKAEYKKMLMNWVVSLALVFLLHYIIIFALTINNTFIKILDGVQTTVSASGNDSFFGKYLTQMLVKSFYPQFTIGWSAAILYVCVVALTFVFLIMYIKRMITIAFLILISPIITITYSIDKLGDGKAQAFSSWLKEFLHNVFIQPFHCLIYLAFTSVAMNLLQHSGTLAATVLVVLTMFFILQAEKLVKKIFGIDSDSTGNAMATAAVLSHAYGKLNLKKPSAPSNVKGVNTAKVAGTSSAKVASMSATNNMVATNNMAAATSATAVASVPVATNSSANLSEKLSGGYAHVEDYDALMGNERQANLGDMSAGQRLAMAQVEDYDALMGNEEQTNISGNTGVNPEAPKVNKVYGVLGKMPEQKAMPEEKYVPERSTVSKAWDTAKSAYNMVSKTQINSGIAGAVVGGSLAGIGGADLAETIGAVGVGRKAQEAIEANAGSIMAEKKQKWENYLKELDMRKNDKKLASDFSKYKNGSEYNSKADIQKTRDYLNMSSEEVANIKNKSEQNFVKSLHATRDLYANTYLDEDPNEKIVETMEKVVNKEIEPED